MLAMLLAMLGPLSTLALASSITVQSQSPSGTSTYLSPSTSAENRAKCYTESHCSLQGAATTPAKVSPSTSRFAVSGCAGPTSRSESSLTNNEAEFELEYWQVAPSFISDALNAIGYLAVDDDVTETMEGRMISARAPSSASSTSISTSIDLTSLFLGPLIPTSTTSTSSSLTSTSSSSKSKSTTTGSSTITRSTTVAISTTTLSASTTTTSKSTSSSSSSTINPFTISLLSSTSSQSTTFSLPPLTSSSSTLSIETLPTNLPAAATTISSALFSNGHPSSSSATTSSRTTLSPISPTSNSAPSTTLPPSSSTMASMNMLPTSSAIGIGAGIGAASLLILSFLAAWFIIRRRRKRYAAEREKRKSGINMVMDTDPTRYEKPDVIASQPSSASAQDAAEMGASGVYEMDAGDSVWAGPGNGQGRMSPRLYRPVQEYGREDERGRSFVG